MKRFTLITLISLVFLEAYSQSDMLDKLREANVDPEEIARDYFTKAELHVELYVPALSLLWQVFRLSVIVSSAFNV